MRITKFLNNSRKVRFILLTITFALVSTLTGVAQDGSGKSSFPLQEADERNLTRILKRQELNKNSDETVRALRALTNRSRGRHLKLPETYLELTRFLDFEFVEAGASAQTNLDTHPAMAALYYAGEDALPFLTAIISQETEGSRKSMLALWTVIYIKEANFRLAYAYLNEAARHSKTRREKERLLVAARKADNLVSPNFENISL